MTSCWFIRRLQKILSRILPVSDDVAMFLVQESAVVLSTRMSNLGWGGCFVLSSSITSSTSLHKNMIAANSRLLILIRAGDLDVSCFIVLCLLIIFHSTHHYNLISGQYTPHPVRHASLGTVQS